MKQLIILILLFSNLSLHAQFSQDELKLKCDSILQESNTLYKHEKAAWVFTDMFLAKPEIKNAFFKYLTYQQEDSIKCIVINKKMQSIYEVIFTDDNNPQIERFLWRDLTEQEAKLIDIRAKALKEISANQYVAVYKDYPPNFILLPFESGYKLYAICGTNKPKTFPFGNDYLFILNQDGEIQSKKQFHSRLISFQNDPANSITKIVHSHLQQEPFISATDICTFRLYREGSNISQMEILSTAFSIYFIYDAETNTITTKALSHKF